MHYYISILSSLIDISLSFVLFYLFPYIFEPDVFGKYMYVNSIVLSFSFLFDFGTSLYFLREYKNLVNSKKLFEKTFTSSLIFNTLIFLLFLPFSKLIALVFYLNFMNNIQVFTKSYAYNNSLFLSDLKFRLFEKLFIYSIILLLYSTGNKGLELFLLCIVLVKLVTLFLYIKKQKIVLSIPNIFDIKKIILDSKYYSLNILVTSLYTQISAIWLGFLVGYKEVGAFKIMTNLFPIIYIFITSFANVYIPKATNKYFSDQNVKFMKSSTMQISVYVLCIVFIFNVIVFSFKKQILQFYPEYTIDIEKIYPYLPFIISFTIFKIIYAHILTIIGLQKIRCLLISSISIVSFFYSYLLIKKYQIEGAAVSFLLNELLLAVVFLTLIIRNVVYAKKSTCNTRLGSIQ